MTDKSQTKLQPPRLHPIFEQCCKESFQEFFSDSGIRSVALETENSIEQFDELQSLVAFVGFTGENIKGSLTFLSQRTFFTTTHPNIQMQVPVEPQDELDWAREVVNQILGRVKNKLLAFNLPFSVSTPSVVIGHQLENPESLNLQNRLFGFQTNRGNVVINFSVVMAEGAQFNRVADSGMGPQKEGKAILF